MFDQQLLTVVVTALFGLGIGSFLNVVILRLPEQQPLTGRSHCPHCNHSLAWYELIPVLSFVILRGRCAHCSSSISLQYPIVELLATTLCVLMALWFWQQPLTLALYTLYSLLLLTIFIYDLKYYLILDVFTVPGIIVACIGGVLLGIGWPDIVIGMLVGGGIFFLQYAVSKGRWVGGGDIRLGVLMGAMLGWPTILVGLFVAYFIGAIVAFGLMLAGKKTMKDMLPFGTFLSGATIFSFLFGHDIIQWYVYDLLKL